MAPQAGGLPETLSTRFARQPLTFFVNFISPHHLKSDKPVESVEALSLASLPSACQVSIVQHWHRHKHKLVPLVPNLATYVKMKEVLVKIPPDEESVHI